jgi:hypothetical protein
MCTLGFFGIGALVDLFLMNWLVKRYNLIAKVKALQAEMDQAAAWKERFARLDRYTEATAKHERELLLQEEIRLLKEELEFSVNPNIYIGRAKEAV